MVKPIELMVVGSLGIWETSYVGTGLSFFGGAWFSMVYGPNPKGSEDRDFGWPWHQASSKEGGTWMQE